MNREHGSKWSLCEKGQVWRGRQRLPYTMHVKGQNNSVAEGKEKTVMLVKTLPADATVLPIQ